MKIKLVIGVFGVSGLLACSNQPIEFTQGKAATMLALKVEKSDDATASAPTEPSYPARTISDDQLGDLMEAFDAEGDSFDPDAVLASKTTEPSAQQDADAVAETDPMSEAPAGDEDETGEGKPAESLPPDDKATDVTNQPAPTETTPPKETLPPETKTPSQQDQAASTPPAKTPDDAPELSEPTEGEKKLCAKLTGVAESDVRSNNKGSIASGKVTAQKVTGKGANVILDLLGDSEVWLQGVCIFLAGSEAKFRLNVGIKVHNLVFIGRGDTSTGSVEISAGGSVGQAVVSLSAHNSSLSISSNGRMDCASIREAKSKYSPSCK